MKPEYWCCILLMLFTSTNLEVLWGKGWVVRPKLYVEMNSWDTVETLKTHRQLGIWQVQGKCYILSKVIKLWGEIEWLSVKVSVTSESSCKLICSFNALEKNKQPFVSYSKCLLLISSKKRKKSWRHRISISTCDTWKCETMTIMRKTKIKTTLFLCLFLDYCITIYVLI